MVNYIKSFAKIDKKDKDHGFGDVEREPARLLRAQWMFPLLTHIV